MSCFALHAQRYAFASYAEDAVSLLRHYRFRQLLFAFAAFRFRLILIRYFLFDFRFAELSLSTHIDICRFLSHT